MESQWYSDASTGARRIGKLLVLVVLRGVLRVVMAILRKHYVTGLYTVEDIAGLDIADCLVVSPEGKRISVTSTHVRPSALPLIQEQAKEHFRARY